MIEVLKSELAYDEVGYIIDLVHIQLIREARG